MTISTNVPYWDLLEMWESGKDETFTEFCLRRYGIIKKESCQNGGMKWYFQEEKYETMFRIKFSESVCKAE